MRRLEVTTSDGKYTVIQQEDGAVHVERYDESWRDCTGDNLVLALAQELAGLREVHAKTLKTYGEDIIKWTLKRKAYEEKVSDLRKVIDQL